jgi:hypothetical protein
MFHRARRLASLKPSGDKTGQRKISSKLMTFLTGLGGSRNKKKDGLD